MGYKDFYDEVGELLEIWNRGEFNPDELIDGIEAALQGVRPTPPTACQFCGHLPAMPNDGLRNLANLTPLR